MRKRLVIGNWKMHGTISEMLTLLTGLQHHIKTAPDLDVVVAPPFTALYSAGIALQDTAFALAAQNCHWEHKGAFTGEVSAPFLADVGCRYVLLGHSERRQYCGETDEQVNRKLNAALRNELIPVLCVGELEAEREAGKTFEVLERQLRGALVGLHYKEIEGIVVAYEPVWAIGTGKIATPGQAVECHQFIRNYLGKHFDAPTAATVRIVYGGSVKPDNVAALAREASIDGCLVGGASLDPEGFAAIIRAMEQTTGRREGN